jgi:hypothetical protein
MQLSAGAATESLTAVELAAAGPSLGVSALGVGLLLAIPFILIGMAALGAHDAQARSSRYESEAAAGHKRYLESLSPADQYFLSPEDKAILAPEEAVGKVILPGARPPDEKAILPGARPPDEKAILPGARPPQGKAILPGARPPDEKAILPGERTGVEKGKAQFAGKTKEEHRANMPEAMKKYLENGGEIRVVTPDVELHHIATDKDKSYAPQFEEIFGNADMTLQDPRNLISIEGHMGPHGPDYNSEILRRLQEAVKGITPHTAEFQKALSDTLAAIAKELAKVGSYLNRLVTSTPSQQ